MKQLLFISTLACGTSFGATLLSDNFDSGSANADWYRRSGITINAGGPAGSANYATINATANAGNGLGDQIGGANNFVIDFNFRVQNDTANRQFNIGVSTASNNPSPGDAAINLRYQGGDSGTFAIYTTAWQTISLGSVTAGSWYRMQIEGIGWGSAGATYTLRLSDAGGNTFTHVLSNLTMVQNGKIDGAFTYGDPPNNNYSGLAQSFIFSTVYGANPGFDIDNVVVTADLVPEPAGWSLMAVGLLGIASRRRRA